MIIYCTGDIHNHGDISMTSRGAYAEGENVYIYKNNDNVYEFVPSFGAKGGIGRGFSYNNTWGKGPIVQVGTNGKNGVGRETGGGGSGCNYLVLEKYATRN